ncbi:MAG: retroviral-like aspartic protease family protein [Campylobacterales bacterium]
MGQFKTQVKVKNFIKGNEIELEALVDTGAMYMSLPRSIIEKLGLQEGRRVNVRTTNGSIQRRVYEGARIYIQDRSVTMDILELPDEVPPLLGVLILDALDFIVDPITQKLAPNPEHHGEYIVDMF